MFCAQGICHPLQQEDSPRRLAYAIAECVIGWVANGAFTEWEKRIGVQSTAGIHTNDRLPRAYSMREAPRSIGTAKIEVNMYYQLKSQQLKMRFVHRIDD